MADSKLKPGLPAQESEEKRLARLKKWRAMALLVFFVLAAGAFLFSAFFMRRALFTANSHFGLRSLELLDGAYWKGPEKEQELCRRIGIVPGVNLFDLDYRQLRKRIEEIPCIEHGEIVRILPDRLRIKVAERIPRAFLFSPGGKFVVDENAVVIPVSECSPQRDLPVITSIPGRKTFRQGERLASLDPALELIMMAVRNFPDINIVCVMPSNEDKLDFFMRYRSEKLYRVTIPLRNRGLPYLLSALQTAIITAHWKRLNVSSFDLRFDGRVVLN